MTETAVTTEEDVADLFLWCSGSLPGFCRISTGDESRPGGRRRPDGPGRYPCACVHGDFLAYLASRPISEDEAEFGARAHGPNAAEAAKLLVDHIRQWNAYGRDIPADAIAYWPIGVAVPKWGAATGVFSKRNGTATVYWGAAEARP